MIDWYPATPALIPLGVKLLLLIAALEGLLIAVLIVALDETGAADVAEAAGADTGVIDATEDAI